MTSPLSNRIVLHIAGADRPGVTARLTEVIAKENAELVDIGQSVLHGYLRLSAIVDIPPSSNALRQILFAVSELGLRLEVSRLEEDGDAAEAPPTTGLCVTVLGPLANGVAVARLTRFMADRRLNIREIRAISDGALTGLELLVELAPGAVMRDVELAALRGEMLRLGMELSVDLAVQKDDIFRRNKRLVCMDVDSTFVKGEFIDELAQLAGCKAAVEAITARAMRGEIDFRGALAERVKLLEGLPMERALTLCERFELTDGAERFVRILQRVGFRVGLVSGGFDFFVDRLKERFDLDFAFANRLEVKDGVLTGKLVGDIVDAQRKADVVRQMAQQYKCHLEQTVAIGDGANDILMLQTAGLGIAFRAKPKLQEVADMSLNYDERLDTLLYLIGFTGRDLRVL